MKKYVKKVFEPIPTKSEYDRIHAEEKSHTGNNLTVTRDEMQDRGFSTIQMMNMAIPTIPTSEELLYEQAKRSFDIISNNICSYGDL